MHNKKAGPPRPKPPSTTLVYGEGGFRHVPKAAPSRPGARVIASEGPFAVELDDNGLYWLTRQGQTTGGPTRSRDRALYMLADKSPLKSAGAPWKRWNREGKAEERAAREARLSAQLAARDRADEADLREKIAALAESLRPLAERSRTAGGDTSRKGKERAR